MKIKIIIKLKFAIGDVFSTNIKSFSIYITLYC